MNRKQRQKMNAQRESSWRPIIVYSNDGSVKKEGMDKLFTEAISEADNKDALEQARLPMEEG